MNVFLFIYFGVAALIFLALFTEIISEKDTEKTELLVDFSKETYIFGSFLISIGWLPLLIILLILPSDEQE